MIRKIIATGAIGMLALRVIVPDPLAAQVLIQKKDPALAEPSSMRMGAGDQISIKVRDADDIGNRNPYRIDENGTIRVPGIVEPVRAGGLTEVELEAILVTELRRTILDPLVTVTITEARSSSFAVVGAVKNPNTFQMRDRITLTRAIILAGGITPEAGYLVRVTRRDARGKIPLSSATVDMANQVSIVEESVDDVMTGVGPAANLLIAPDDLVSIAEAPLIYVNGEVHSPGGIALARREPHLPVSEALNMANGPTAAAALNKAAILRPQSQGALLQRIDVDLKKIRSGKAEDLQMSAGDTLVIPNNNTMLKTLMTMAMGMGVSTFTGITIVRAGRR